MGRITAKASAKLLLFGEHSVLYGYPALGIPLPYFLKITYEPTSDNQWYLSCLTAGFESALHGLLSFYESQWPPLSHRRGTLTLEGDVPLGLGFGSSGSLCVALTRLFSQLLGLQLTKQESWQIAHEAEKLFHGQPSGVDTGLIIWEEPSYFWMNLPHLPEHKLVSHFPEWWLVIGALPRTESTKVIIQNFRERLFENPRAETNLKELGEISACAGLDNIPDFPTMACLVNRAQFLLQDLGFSNESLDRVLTLGLSMGASAGKLSGAGKGGAFYFLCERKEQADELCGRLSASNEINLIQDFIVIPLRF